MTAHNHDRRPTYRTTIDRTVPISTAVVFAVADVAGIDPETAPPLSESVDPSSLDRFIVDSQGAPDVGTLAIEFEYLGFQVTISGDGTIHVR